MAKRKSLIRKRGSSRRSFTGSGFLDPDTNIVGEERNFWWDDLQENTPRHSMIFGVNETDRQLSAGSRLVSDKSSPEWWKNLSPESEQTASPSPRLKRNLSAVIVKTNVLQTSTSESEKEVSIKKRKVQLKMNSRKSTGNAFSTALNDTDVTMPNSRKKRANHSDSHGDREVLQEKLQEDEEDNNLSLTGHVLKSKPSIYRRRRGDSTKDQNPFQDVLTQDSALSHSATRKSVALEKESSRHSIHRNINASKDLTDDRSKLVRTLQATPEKGDSSNLLTSNVENAALESNTEEIDQSSDLSEKIVHSKYEKLKSRFMQRARKSIGRNAFADALVDDANLSTFDPNRENDVQKSPLMQQASSLSRRAVSRSKTKIDAAHENSPIRKSPRVSRSTTKKQSLDVPTQAKDITEATSSSTLMSDNDEFRRKKSAFLKPKSRIIESLRQSSTENPFAEILEKDGSINVRGSNVSTENNLASLERGEVTRVSQARQSLATEESSKSKRNRITSSTSSNDIVLGTTSSDDEHVSKRFHVSSKHKSKKSEDSDPMNTSKSISRRSAVAKTPEKEISFSRNSTREETLQERTRTNATLTAGSTSTNQIAARKIMSDDSDRDDIDVDHDSNISKRVSSLDSSMKVRLTRNSLRNLSETPKPVNTRIHEAIDNSDTNKKHDSNMSKRVSSLDSSMESRLTRNSLRNRSETSKPVNTRIHEAIDNLHSDTNEKHDSNISKQLSKSDAVKKTRLTRGLRNRSEMPERMNVEEHEVIDNDANKEHESSIAKQLFNSSSGKEARLTRKNLRSLSKISGNADFEINIDDISASQVISSTRISKTGVSKGSYKRTILLSDVEITEDEDTGSGMQTNQRKPTLTKAETGNKAINQSVPSSSKTSQEGGVGRRDNLNKSQSHRNTPVKTPRKASKLSFEASKLNSPKTQETSIRKIDDFFKVKQASTRMNKSNERASQSQIFNTEKMEKVKAELERIKNREMAAMKIAKESALKAQHAKSVALRLAVKKPPANPTKAVHKAFLVNGKPYKAPKLPRPKYWATDRLYRFLWQRMEPKYKLATRVKSETFVQELAKIVSVIERRKKYENYEVELKALLKEMSRLNIITTRSDFYHFCQDYMPYEFRVKVVPMIQPGNKMNIPFDPEKLHVPLLGTE